MDGTRGQGASAVLCWGLPALCEAEEGTHRPPWQCHFIPATGSPAGSLGTPPGPLPRPLWHRSRSQPSPRESLSAC